VLKYILLITDGMPNLEDELLHGVVEKIKEDKIRLLAVGIGTELDEELLKSMVSTEADYVFADDFRGLKLIENLMVDLVDCSPTLAPEACAADIVFCLDNSESIGTENWPLVQVLVQDLIKQLNVGPDSTHVGLVDFGYEGYFDFGLNQHMNESSVLQAVSHLPYRSEYTDTAGGLKWAHTVITQAKYGRRGPKVPKIIIVMTDGEPNVNEDQLPVVVKAIKKSGVRLVAVGIGKQVKESTMLSLVSKPSDYVYAESYSSLDNIKRLVVEIIGCYAFKLPRIPV